MEKVNKTVIHADGGSWIRGIGELMPNPVYVMDGFHLKKYMKKIIIEIGKIQEKNLKNLQRK